MNNIVTSLVDRFRQIGTERIVGLPIYNDALHVEAIEFQPCAGGQIGVLVTPWFMNIMLLPDDTSAYQHQELGEKVKYQLVSGEHEFVIGEDEQVGRYLFRTVTSPTHCYKKQIAAVNSGSNALKALLTPSEEVGELPGNTQQVSFTPGPAGEKHDLGRRKFLKNLMS